jgi:hypothetical protein
MSIQATFPHIIYAEVKFTTSRAIVVPDRELAPLNSSDPSITGLLAGYRSVIVNTIGVPDVVASDPAQEDGQTDFRLTVEESRRLVQHCRHAGDIELTSRLLSQDRRLA